MIRRNPTDESLAPREGGTVGQSATSEIIAARNAERESRYGCLLTPPPATGPAPSKNRPEASSEPHPVTAVGLAANFTHPDPAPTAAPATCVSPPVQSPYVPLSPPKAGSPRRLSPSRRLSVDGDAAIDLDRADVASASRSSKSAPASSEVEGNVFRGGSRNTSSGSGASSSEVTMAQCVAENSSEIEQMSQLLSVDKMVLGMAITLIGCPFVWEDMLEEARNYRLRMRSRQTGSVKTPVYDVILSKYTVTLGSAGRRQLKSAISSRLGGDRLIHSRLAAEISPLKQASVQQLLRIAEAVGCLETALKHISFQQQSKLRLPFLSGNQNAQFLSLPPAPTNPSTRSTRSSTASSQSAPSSSYPPVEAPELLHELSVSAGASQASASAASGHSQNAYNGLIPLDFPPSMKPVASAPPPVDGAVEGEQASHFGSGSAGEDLDFAMLASAVLRELEVAGGGSFPENMEIPSDQAAVERLLAEVGQRLGEAVARQEQRRQLEIGSANIGIHPGDTATAIMTAGHNPSTFMQLTATGGSYAAAGMHDPLLQASAGGIAAQQGLAPLPAQWLPPQQNTFLGGGDPALLAACEAQHSDENWFRSRDPNKNFVLKWLLKKGGRLEEYQQLYRANTSTSSSSLPQNSRVSAPDPSSAVKQPMADSEIWNIHQDTRLVELVHSWKGAQNGESNEAVPAGAGDGRGPSEVSQEAAPAPRGSLANNSEGRVRRRILDFTEPSGSGNDSSDSLSGAEQQLSPRSSWENIVKQAKKVRGAGARAKKEESDTCTSVASGYMKESKAIRSSTDGTATSDAWVEQSAEEIALEAAMPISFTWGYAQAVRETWSIFHAAPQGQEPDELGPLLWNNKNTFSEPKLKA